MVDTVTGEVLALARNDGEKWYAVDVNLDRVALAVGTAGIGNREREKHINERTIHRSALMKGRKVNDS